MADDVKPRRKRWRIDLHVGEFLFGSAEGASILRAHSRALASICVGSLTEERREVWTASLELARKASPLPVGTVLALTKRGFTLTLERLR